MWDRPPRLGFARQAVEKLRSLFQLAEFDGCRTTSQISFVSRLATAGRAPFGIRFKMLELPAGWLMMPSCDEVTIDVVAALFEMVTDADAAAVADDVDG